MQIISHTAYYYIDLITDMLLIKETSDLIKYDPDWLQAVFILVYCILYERYITYKLLIELIKK